MRVETSVLSARILVIENMNQKEEGEDFLTVYLKISKKITHKTNAVFQ